MFSAISFGVLRRSAPSTSAIMRSRNDWPGSCVISTTMRSREHARAAGDRAAVAAGLADDRGRLAGDRRLVDRGDALDHGAVAGDDLARLDDHDVAAVQLGGGALGAVLQPRGGLGAHRRAARRPGRAPRPSASASARLAKTTVSHSQIATVKVNQRRLVAAAERLAAEDLDEPARSW